jgi:hypothetical protein
LCDFRFTPIASNLLHHGNGRKRPIATKCAAAHKVPLFGHLVSASSQSGRCDTERLYVLRFDAHYIVLSHLARISSPGGGLERSIHLVNAQLSLQGCQAERYATSIDFTTASSVRSDGIRTVIMTMCVSLCYIA